MHEALARGAALFDAGAFFEAHEVWEELWRASADPEERLFLQGLIQVAATFHKLLVMRGPDAAVRLAGRALSKLDRCPDRRDGVDVAALRDAIRRATRAIEAGAFDSSMIPRLGPRS